MEKLKRYNQALLAILGTLVILFLLGTGIFLLGEMYSHLFWEDDYQEVSIVSNEEAARLVQDSTTSQVVSFNSISLVDTLNEIYIIPVSQSYIGEDYYLEESELLGMTNTYSRTKGERYYLRTDYKSNLLHFNKKTNAVKEIFSRRLIISSYDKIVFHDKLILLIRVIEEDTNKDGFMTTEDLMQMYFYNVSEEKLVKVDTPNKDFIKLSKLYDREEYLVFFGSDLNRDGIFQSYKEPSFLYKIDIETGVLEQLIDDDLILKLQKRLDGRLKLGTN